MMMKYFNNKNRALKIVLLLIACSALFIQAHLNTTFEKLQADFYSGFTKLEISNLQINYVNYLENIPSKSNLEQQRLFFEEMERRWNTIDTAELSENEYLDYQILGYEIDVHQDRLHLERKWDKHIKLDDNKSIHSIPYGKEWYAYLLKKWVDKTVTPNELFEFGAKEIQKVEANMSKIQKASGLSEEAFQKYLNDKHFLIHAPDAVQSAFEATHEKVLKTAPNIFPYVAEIPEVRIARGTNTALAHTPAYYSNNTFYYNLFDKPFNNRQVVWFYAHEAIPGHHYQGAVNQLVHRSLIQDLFWYPGYVEGWGAYVEHLGKELGVYESIYDEYGKWEWDLIRSVRVCMDIGINFRGWTDEQAHEFWASHIKNQKDIAYREIARMKRWPAQVITYKYGSAIFLSLLNQAKKKADFNYVNFHQKMLQHGDIPMSILLQNWNRKNVKES